MRSRGSVSSWLALMLLLGFSPLARAQFAVVDVGAITQLIQQVQTMREQLTTAENQLAEARSTLQAMRGGRGMEQLLAGTLRNYLPADWATIEAVIAQSGGSYAGLAAEIQAILLANRVLTPEQLLALSPTEREQVMSARRSAALLQAMTRQALATTSTRFSAVQQLIAAIPGAADQKAILDLQARIAAEQGMLQNEQTKLDVLYRAAEAEEWARRQRLREQAIDNIGSLRRLPPMGLAL